MSRSDLRYSFVIASLRSDLEYSFVIAGLRSDLRYSFVIASLRTNRSHRSVVSVSVYVYVNNAASVDPNRYVL